MDLGHFPKKIWPVILKIMDGMAYREGIPLPAAPLNRMVPPYRPPQRGTKGTIGPIPSKAQKMGLP